MYKIRKVPRSKMTNNRLRDLAVASAISQLIIH